MVQCYYVPERLPHWMWVKNYIGNHGTATYLLRSYDNYTGKWRTWTSHTTDNEYSESDYVDGKRHGKYTRWNENGVKSYEAFYKNDQQVGKEFSWYESGAKGCETDYGTGQEKQKAVCYYENGKVYSETIYLNNEPIKTIKWYKNGNKKTIYTFKDGQLYDRSNWNEDGTPY